ncbi:MAG: glycoside hydrolase family 18 protein [Cytophagales bacterium]|nr:MAG: glycoside hydrolase family 18 protein [Cytophagales bacterium]
MSSNQLDYSRRNFLKNSLTGALVAPDILVSGQENARKRPRNPVLEKHRNLFNGDTCVFFYNPELWQPEEFTLKTVVNPRTGKLNPKPTAEGGPFRASAIHRYVDTLADNGIDTFIINANASRAWYPSKTIPTILEGYTRGNREFFRGHAICQGITEPEAVEAFLDSMVPFMNRYQDLLNAGVDWLAETATACRQRQVSPWVSIRMNDMHGHMNFEGSFFNVLLLKQKEMRLKNSSYGDQNYLYRQGLNYEKKEVRDFMFAQIREVVEDYDFEGLELDWWRQPLCCEPNASPQTVRTITDWIREIRALTKRRAKQTGRPYPLSLRIPARLDLLRSIGLDVPTLCREGLVDLVCPSGFYCTTWDMPHDTLRAQLGDRVAIYGVLEDGVNTLPTLDKARGQTQSMRRLPASPALIAGNAAGKLALGADGIEWFNFFCTDQPNLPGLRADYSALGQNHHQLDQLRGRPKHYSLATGGPSPTLTPFELPAQLPALLEPNGQRAFRVPMCAEPSDRNLELRVQVVLRADTPMTFMALSVNGSWPTVKNERTDELLFPSGPQTHLTNTHVGYLYRFPVSLVREGWNEIVVENNGKQPFTIAAIELGIMSK